MKNVLLYFPPLLPAANCRSFCDQKLQQKKKKKKREETENFALLHFVAA